MKHRLGIQARAGPRCGNDIVNEALTLAILKLILTRLGLREIKELEEGWGVEGVKFCSKSICSS
jgi:hypothetical protein